MKKIKIIFSTMMLLMLNLICINYVGKAESAVNFYGLICGISVYGSGYTDDYICVSSNNAFEVSNAILTYPNWSFLNVETWLNNEVTKDRIKLYFENMKAFMDENDVFLFYFSGLSGCSLEVSEPFDEMDFYDEVLYTYESNVSISDDELESWISALPTKKFIIILDTGWKTDGSPDLLVKGDGFAADLTSLVQTQDIDANNAGIIMAGAPEYWDSHMAESGNNSLFSHHLIQGIYGMASMEESISVEEVFAYAEQNTYFDSNYEQEPQMYDSYPGEFVFLYRDTTQPPVPPVRTGSLDGDGADDILAFYEYSSGETRIHVWTSRQTEFEYQWSSGWWKSTGYTANKITARVVKGDYNNDGMSDVAAFYDYGNSETRIHVWVSTGSSLKYYGEFGWWGTTGYTPDQITSRVVSGDYNNDGLDDIAAFYDYGNGETRIHVWTSTGHSFNYSGSEGWWKTVGYRANKITDRVVSGDYNQDGLDDIAAFFDYGNGETRIHVWLSTGATFVYSGEYGWWGSNGYSAGNVTSRVVSGDYNSDGIDDIAAFYDYGNGETRIHVWTSTGTSFKYAGSEGWWRSTGYSVMKVSGRIMSGDYNHDGKDDIAGFYDYGNGETRIHVWTSTGTSFKYTGSEGWWGSKGYNAEKITNRCQ